MNVLYLLLAWGAVIFLMTRMPRPPGPRELLAVALLACLLVIITVHVAKRIEQRRRDAGRALNAVDRGPRRWDHGIVPAATRHDMAVFNGQPYILSADGRTITCATCGLTSHNLDDVRARYCGHCHVFHPGLSGAPRSSPLDVRGVRPS